MMNKKWEQILKQNYTHQIVHYSAIYCENFSGNGFRIFYYSQSKA